jgi:multidrug efflux system membrane fusion protein
MTIFKNTVLACLFGLSLSAGAPAADVSAVVAWSQKVELGTLVSGVVSEVHVRPGQVVAKGDKLISLDARGFNAQVNRRLAAYKHAESTLEEAMREDERAIELYDRTVLSDFERNQALIALHAARARAEAARADLTEARLNLEHSVVLAPFDGLVLSVGVSPGQTIVSEWQSQPLVTLADNRVYRAHAQIDGVRAGQLQVGGELQATLRGKLAQASVGYVGFEPVAQSEQGPLYDLVVEIVAGDGEPLRVGETVILHLE